MTYFPVFLSVVLIVRNESGNLKKILSEATDKVSKIVADYELIVVDNASVDDSVFVLQELCAPGGLPNLQVYSLTKEVDRDTAAWVGVENALGDFVSVFDPLQDDLEVVPQMLEHAVRGVDVVFANNLTKAPQSLTYKVAYAGFDKIYKYLNGIQLSKEVPLCRLLSRTVVNFILRHPSPELSYRLLPATGGFSKFNFDYSSPVELVEKKSVREALNRGVRLLISTSRAPMRLITLLCLFGSVANVIYSIYVLFISLFKENVTSGWASLSLQQSGMFFLVSFVLLILSEYIMHMLSLFTTGPSYHIAKELTSARLERRERLNIEDPSKLGVPRG